MDEQPKNVARMVAYPKPELTGKVPLRFIPSRSFAYEAPGPDETIWTGTRVENGEGIIDLVCDRVVQVIERGGLQENLYLLESNRMMDASGLVSDGQHALGSENELSVEFVKREIYYRKIEALTSPMVLSRLTEPELSSLLFTIVNRVQRLGVSGTPSKDTGPAEDTRTEREFRTPVS